DVESICNHSGTVDRAQLNFVDIVRRAAQSTELKVFFQERRINCTAVVRTRRSIGEHFGKHAAQRGGGQAFVDVEAPVVQSQAEVIAREHNPQVKVLGFFRLELWVTSAANGLVG